MSDFQVLLAEHVLTVDDAMNVYSPGAVVVSGRDIVKVGNQSEILAEYQDEVARGAEVCDFGNKLIMPGCVNTHCHFPMVLMRGLGADMEVMSWLESYVFPLEAELLCEEFVRDASFAGTAELLRNGYTTVLDMYYYSEEQAKVCAEMGIRAVLATAVVGFPTKQFANPDLALADAEMRIEEWKGHELITYCLGPHSTYTVSPDLMKRCKEISERTGTLLHIHAAENVSEVETIRAMYSTHPIDHLNNLGILGPNVILAHCVQIGDEHIKLLAATGTSVAHNPCSNLKLSSGIAPVVKMREAGVNVSLGTDGPMTSDRMDPFHVMDITGKIHKYRQDNPSVMKAKDVVRMSTIEGARVLGMGDQIGSLETGKRADLIVLDYMQGQYAPVYDLYAHLLYACHGEKVTAVMVNGAWVVRNKQVVNVNEDEIRARSENWKHVIDQIVIKITEKH